MHRPPTSAPTRARYARVRCFSFFAFTSSPYDCKKLRNSDLRVKVSAQFPSPVKEKTGLPFTHNAHCINNLWVKVKGEGKKFELAECAMRRGVSVRAYGCADEETVGDTVGEGTGVFSKKRGERREKKGRFERKSTSFYSTSPYSQKPKHFSHKIFDSSKLNPYFCT